MLGADWDDESRRDVALHNLVQQRIDKVNGQLASFETIKKFVIIPTALTVESGLLTASLKVRRKKVYEAFKHYFEGMYE
jgi:long-chain acyl-CoA synthetase